MTNEHLQELAEELTSLDRDKDSERARTIEVEIVEYELGLLKNINDMAYFPLLKKFNGQLPFEEFYDMFIDVLLHLLRNYDPGKYESEKKASFTTVLSYTINLRANDIIRKRMEKQKNEMPFSVPSEDDDEGVFQSIDISDESNDPGVLIEQSSPFVLFISVAPLITLRKAQEKNLPKSKKSYFEGFYTFDTIDLTKKGIFPGDDVIRENDELFPLMEEVVLNYLLVFHGAFTNMRNVVYNDIKDENLLKRRIETMQKCYTLSKPTVVGRNQRYRVLFSAVSEAALQ
ncbi:MAG: hypothetical protein FWH52_05665 [Synergistaceae bacterium]|nr:hypothetical protein [Synergistaceae bacterium]